MYEELYARNRGLLHLVARHYAAACQRDRAVSVEDLEQAGFFGLVKATQTYQDAAGYSWSTWAAWYISGEICKALGYRWKPATESTPAHYVATRAHTDAYSLDAPLAADDPEGMTWEDTLADDTVPEVDEAVNLESLQRYVREAVERLENPQQHTVIQRCDLDGKPYRAAAEELGVSTERVRHIRDAALRQLRRDRKLRENARADIELRTPYYCKVGVKQFQNTRTSATEKAALWRIEQKDRLLRERTRLEQLAATLEGPGQPGGKGTQ